MADDDFNEMIKQNDANKKTDHQTRLDQNQQEQAERNAAAQRAAAWFRDVLLTTINEVNASIDKTLLVSFESGPTEKVMDSCNCSITISRRQWTSSPYVFTVRQDYLRVENQLKLHPPVTGARAATGPKHTVNQRSVVAKYSSVGIGEANAAWVKMILREILQENMKHMPTL